LITFNKIKMKKRLLIFSSLALYPKGLFINLRIGSVFRVAFTLAMGLFILTSGYAQLSGYKYRKEITIQSSQVTGNLTDFPVLVSMTDADLATISQGGRVEHSSGFDIAITPDGADCSSSNALDYELEYYDSTSGKLAMWVKIPSLSSSSNTTIYLLYGNDQITTDQSTNNVWSNNYTGVYHLNDDFDNSVSGSYNGTDYNTSSVSSIVGNAREFDASGDSIAISSDIIPATGNFTISCWFNFQGTTNSTGHTLYDVFGDHNTNVNRKYFYGGFTDSQVRFYYECSNDQDAQAKKNRTINSDTWYHYTGVGGWTQNSHRLFLNGSLLDDQNKSVSGNLFSPRTNLLLGDRNVNYGNFGRFTGIIDEFRVSSVKRSNEWVETEYNNISSPSTFISVGTEEAIIASTITDGDYNDASTWGGGVVPNSFQSVVYIDHDVSVDVNISASELVIGNGNSLTIESAITAHVCQIENLGQLTIEPTGSLLQSTSTDLNTGSGTYSVKRSTGTLIDDARYQYWGSPIQNATMGNVYVGANSNDFYFFNESSQAWASQASGSAMTPGRGYITTSTVGLTNSSETRTFTGTINNADIDIVTSASNGNYFLTSNPYPSAISSTDFVTANSDLGGTLYFWNHTTDQVGGGSGGVNTAADYASWNSTGSTSGNGGELPDDYIQSAQGFFVEANASNPTVSFTNELRVSGNNSQFFKKEATSTKNRVWLALSNDSNDYNQLLLGFLPEATDGVDRLYDGKKFKAHPRIAFYSLLDSVDHSIQGLQTPTYLQEKRIPLGIDAWISGSHTIKIDSLDNWPDDYSIILIDHELDSIHDLRVTENYKFEVIEAGVFKNRFELGITDTEEEEEDDEPTNVAVVNSLPLNLFSSNGEVIIESEKSAIKRILIHDVQGRLISDIQPNDTRASVPVSKVQLAIVSVELANGAVTKKLLHINL
jgi:hypothetical protein